MLLIYSELAADRQVRSCLQLGELIPLPPSPATAMHWLLTPLPPTLLSMELSLGCLLQAASLDGLNLPTRNQMHLLRVYFLPFRVDTWPLSPI